MGTQDQCALILRTQTCVTQLQVALHYSPRNYCNGYRCFTIIFQIIVFMLYQTNRYLQFSLGSHDH